jgi:hypothetical protein
MGERNESWGLCVFMVIGVLCFTIKTQIQKEKFMFDLSMQSNPHNSAKSQKKENG